MKSSRKRGGKEAGARTESDNVKETSEEPIKFIRGMRRHVREKKFEKQLIRIQRFNFLKYN